MNALFAVDDGLTNGNYNVADIFFLIATIFAGLAGLAYMAGFPVAEGAPASRYGRFTHWAAALVAFAVACVAFAWFLL